MQRLQDAARAHVQWAGAVALGIAVAGCGPIENWKFWEPEQQTAARPASAKGEPRAASRSADAEPPQRPPQDEAEASDDPVRRQVDEYVRGFDDGSRENGAAKPARPRARGVATDPDQPPIYDPRDTYPQRRSPHAGSAETVVRQDGAATVHVRDPGGAPLANAGRQPPESEPAGDFAAADQAVNGPAPGGYVDAAAAYQAPPPAPIAEARPPRVQAVSVSAAGDREPADASAGMAARTNRPANTASGRPMQERIAELERAVRADPEDFDAQLRLRLLYVAEGMDARALAPPAGLTAERGEMLLATTRQLIAARASGGRDSAAWANRQLSELDTLRSTVRQQADLQVPRLEMCRSTESFGVYEPFAPAEFPAGRATPVLAYVEIGNFAQDSGGDGRYRTRLAARLAILDGQGREVWSRSDERIEDVSRNRRTDFFVSLDVSIPAELPPGEYTLKASVTDLVGQKTNEARKAFKLTAS